MRLKQEQTVFVLALLVLGLMTWGLLKPKTARRTPRRSGESAEFTNYPAPDVSIATSNGARPPLGRELFSKPRDTRPLPPLELIEPPMRPLAQLLPPTDPGPAPLAYGELLRRDLPIVEAAGLFDGIEGGAEESDDPFLDGASDDLDPNSSVLREEEATVQELLAELSEAGEDPFTDETPAEREARYARYRGEYDWIQIGPGQTIFGRIENEDRYGLVTDSSRATEAIAFVEVDPITGKAKLASVGAPPVNRERASFTAFGFAETVANELAIRRLELPDPLTRGGFEKAMVLADDALRNRHEAAQALAMAEELYRLCIAYDPKDYQPRLGLAETLEAGFRFEEAFAEYRTMLEEFPGRAEPQVRLALLEERFLLISEAEAGLRRAVEIDGASWEAQRGLSAFLARRGRHEEAIPFLSDAVQNAPTKPELLYVRVANRIALADAYFALGDVEAARDSYTQALSADPAHQRAKAGVLALDVLTRDPDLAGSGGASGSGAGAASDAGEDEAAGFDLLLARGLEALVDQDWERSRDAYQAAVDADPLRASKALTGLAFLAAITSNDADALGFVEEAIERDPRNAYALYLRGRMLGQQDDYEGARESLIAALDREVDFEDALVALGDMAFRLGRFEDAERYLERAVAIDGQRAEVHALRGTNFLRLGVVGEAREAFAAALALDGDEPTAAAGKAWCSYLEGDATEAIKLLADLDDARRDRPEEDEWRVWARAQIERVNDHDEKVEWTDSFNRTLLKNGWYTRQSDGPTVGMRDGVVKVEGQFEKPDGKAQVYRDYIASDFVSLSARVRLVGENPVRAGIFVAREQQRRGEEVVIGEASVSRHEDGSLQVRFIRQGQPVTTLDMEQTFPLGEWVRLTILRGGVSSDTTVTILMDGIPLLERVNLPSIGGASGKLIVGLLVEGDRGRRCLVEMDDVSVVYRGNR